MNYQDWRQQFRLLKAMEMLADGCHISQVAQYLEFVSDSAFIAFFHQHTGTTPGRYSLSRGNNAAEGLGVLHIKDNLPSDSRVGRSFTDGREKILSASGRCN